MASVEAQASAILALDGIVGQPRARAFLEAAVREGRLSHAYLFVGAAGSGIERAARALAKCVVCPQGGDNTCEECLRVEHGTHPDVHFYEPASAVGYMMDQVREIISDAQLTSVRSDAKVYVIQHAERLRSNCANALLKTIEEPPAGVVFVLLANSADAVLPTIVSRCQVVPFRVISPDAAAVDVARDTGASEADARIALNVCGSYERACEWLCEPEPLQSRQAMEDEIFEHEQSKKKASGRGRAAKRTSKKKEEPKQAKTCLRTRRQARLEAFRAIGSLAQADSWEALKAADRVCECVVRGKDDRELDERYEKMLTDRKADYLSAKASKDLVESRKREFAARERSAMMEVLVATESLLRDVLVLQEGAVAPLVNTDQTALVERLSRESTAAGTLAAIRHVSSAADDIRRNATPQLALEAMLLSVKEDLTCPPSSR